MCNCTCDHVAHGRERNRLAIDRTTARANVQVTGLVWLVAITITARPPWAICTSEVANGVQVPPILAVRQMLRNVNMELLNQIL
jgi:hypothetical protein